MTYLVRGERDEQDTCWGNLSYPVPQTSWETENRDLCMLCMYLAMYQTFHHGTSWLHTSQTYGMCDIMANTHQNHPIISSTYPPQSVFDAQKQERQHFWFTLECRWSTNNTPLLWGPVSIAIYSCIAYLWECIYIYEMQTDHERFPSPSLPPDGVMPLQCNCLTLYHKPWKQ